jgi:hypothetical protein
MKKYNLQKMVTKTTYKNDDFKMIKYNYKKNNENKKYLQHIENDNKKYEKNDNLKKLLQTFLTKV